MGRSARAPANDPNKVQTVSMKLFYSRNSPYARIARVAAIESGLAGEIEHIEVVNRSPDSPLLRYSPVCCVPTLVHDGLVLGEARNICAYLDHLAGQPQLLENGRRRWDELGLESIIVGFLDGIAVWARECRRPAEEQSAFLFEVEKKRAIRCLDHFESSAVPRPESREFSRIALACALGAMEFHALMYGWDQRCPVLSEWYRERAECGSMAITRPG